jgi:hypothetical protein
MKQFFFVLFSFAMVLRINADSIAVVIDQPGEYTFQSITANPTDLNDCAISIQASDVIVNFVDSFITQQVGNQIGGFSGIRVADGLSNIIIKNINIKFLTGTGIEFGEGCENIEIENVVIDTCNAGGIIFAGSMSSPIKDGSLKDCFVFSCTGVAGSPAYGIRLIRCDNFKIRDCIFNKNDSATTNSGFGLSLEYCTACKVLDCDANNNGGNALGVGISLYQAEWTLVQNCKVLNSIARASMASKAVGILVDQCTHTVIKNCLVKHSNNSLVDAYGFECCNGSNNLFTHCLTKNNTGATAAAGFNIHGNELKTSVANCKSRGNDGGVSGVGYGIFLDTAQSCDILFNELLNNSGATGYGLVDTVTNTTNLISGNIAFGNTTDGFDVTRTSGTFPLISAQVGDFTAISDKSRLYNVNFDPGP